MGSYHHVFILYVLKEALICHNGVMFYQGVCVRRCLYMYEVRGMVINRLVCNFKVLDQKRMMEISETLIV